MGLRPPVVLVRAALAAECRLVLAASGYLVVRLLIIVMPVTVAVFASALLAALVSRGDRGGRRAGDRCANSGHTAHPTGSDVAGPAGSGPDGEDHNERRRPHGGFPA